MSAEPTLEYIAYLEQSVELLREELEQAREAKRSLVRRIWELEEQLGIHVAVLRYGEDSPSSEE